MLNTTLHKKKKVPSKTHAPITISKYINDRFALKSFELGTGSFGSVHLGEETDPITKKKREVAIKKVRLEKYPPEYFKYLLAEIDIMAQCQCENIISLIDKIEIPRRELYLVMDLCSANFKEYILSKRRLKEGRDLLLPEKEIQYWMKQIGTGLRYLHVEMKVCHRDIKPHNLLLKKKGQQIPFNYYSRLGSFDEYVILISDFGLSKFLGSDMVTETVLGTQFYKSPQITQFQPYSFDADIFALGVVLFEMITGYCLFGSNIINPKPVFGEKISTLTQNIEWSFLSNALDISPELLDLVSGMLEFEVGNRLTIEQVLEHPFFSIDFNPPTPPTIESIPEQPIPELESALPVPYDPSNEISPNIANQVLPTIQVIIPTSTGEETTPQNTQQPVIEESQQEVEPIKVRRLERDETTPTTFSEFVSFSYERVGLPQDYTRVSIIKDEIGAETLTRSENISKSKHSKVLILLSSDSNKTFNYSIKVRESPLENHAQSGTVSSTIEFELEDIEREMITLDFELSHSLTNRWLSYFTTPELIPFTIEVYVQTKIPEHSSILSISE